TITKRAVTLVEKSTAASPRKPFFLYFALTAPHYPIVPSEQFQGKSQAANYGDFVVQVDHTVGQVMRALDDAGVANDTLVIFTSDNGPGVARKYDVGAYERIRASNHASMGNFRGVKSDAWEGGHRVPFIARWPAQIKAAAQSDETICHVDFMA